MHPIAAERPARNASSSSALLQVRRLFTVADYYRMGETGLIGPDERTDLLDGEVVYQMPASSRHAGCVNLLAEILMAQVSGRAVVSVRNRVRLSTVSEPKPDIAILAPRPDRYREAHPLPADVFLLIEVSNTTLDLERQVKAPLYAAAGIPELWIIDLVNDAIECYRDPDARGYRQVKRAGRGDRIRPGAFPDVGLDVGEVLGPVG